MTQRRTSPRATKDAIVRMQAIADGQRRMALILQETATLVRDLEAAAAAQARQIELALTVRRADPAAVAQAPMVADFDAPRRVNGLRHNPRQFCSMTARGYVARDFLSPAGL